MLFFTRAFICIGAVVLLAEGFAPGDLVETSKDVAGAATPDALKTVAALCRSTPETCAGLAATAVKAITADQPRSADAAHAPEHPKSKLANDRRPRPSELSFRPAVPR